MIRKLMVSKFWAAITRKKTSNDAQGTHLARVLSLVDLVAFGIGSTLGLGVYVLAGSVAKTFAGPAASLSFLLAAIVSLFGGLNYVEFAARVPRTGYSYAYCYAGVGELVAFVVGWNLLLGAMLGASGVASGMSSYIDTLFDKQISTNLAETFPINVPYLASSPDFLSLGIILLITVLLAAGMKESSMFNKICTSVNLMIIVTVIVACLIKADIKNWRISKEEIDQQGEEGGAGGFLPYGITGVIAGVPNCFFGLLGFDAPAVCSEEAKNPKRDIPLAILITLCFIFIVYFGLSTVLTLAWPYYLQNKDAPFPHIFAEFGWTYIEWIVTIGALFALSTTALGSMYFAPRILYAIANDGLIFKSLAKVNPVTKTPLISTVLSGIIASLMATFLQLDALMDLMTIGSFFSYTIVAISVIVLRYENTPTETQSKEEFEPQAKKHYYKIILNVGKNEVPTRTTSIIANTCAVLFSLVTAVLCILLNNTEFFANTTVQYVSCAAVVVVMICLTLIIFRQPQTDAKISFKVPLVPFMPCISIIFNLYLMMQLGMFTWIGFLGWISIGCVVYFFYGINHSEENKSTEN